MSCACIPCFLLTSPTIIILLPLPSIHQCCKCVRVLSNPSPHPSPVACLAACARISQCPFFAVRVSCQRVSPAGLTNDQAQDAATERSHVSYARIRLTCCCGAWVWCVVGAVQGPGQMGCLEIQPGQIIPCSLLLRRKRVRFIICCSSCPGPPMLLCKAAVCVRF